MAHVKQEDVEKVMGYIFLCAKRKSNGKYLTISEAMGKARVVTKYVHPYFSGVVYPVSGFSSGRLISNCIPFYNTYMSNFYNYMGLVDTRGRIETK